jgi:hypothetical protein
VLLYSKVAMDNNNVHIPPKARRKDCESFHNEESN